MFKPNLTTFCVMKNRYICEKHVCAPLTKDGCVPNMDLGSRPCTLRQAATGWSQRKSGSVMTVIRMKLKMSFTLFNGPLYHNVHLKLNLMWSFDADRLSGLFEHISVFVENL